MFYVDLCTHPDTAEKPVVVVVQNAQNVLKLYKPTPGGNGWEECEITGNDIPRSGTIIYKVDNKDRLVLSFTTWPRGEGEWVEAGTTNRVASCRYFADKIPTWVQKLLDSLPA